MRPLAGRPLALLLLSLVAAAGCVDSARQADIPPEFNFAAHRDSEGVVIDKMESGRSGIVVPADCPLFFCNGPQLLLRRDDVTQAAFWLAGTTTVVRGAADDAAPRLGKVQARSENAAVHLTLIPDGGEAFETSIFQRIDGGYATLDLGQPTYLTIAMRGRYRATIVDDKGDPAGWLSVQIQHQSPKRVYEGVLPPALNGPLAAAAVARLDAAIDVAQSQAFDPYLGN